jgi:hypothetical protein
MKSLKLPITKRLFLHALLLTAFCPAISQTLGGNSAYNFLKLPNTPQLSALGGVNISNMSNDAGMAFNNPSLLREEMQQQLHVSFNNMYAGIKNYHSYFAYRYEKWQTNFGAGVHFLDYGTIAQTDAAGNVSGSFHPNDYVAVLAASRKYAEKWYYGVTLKFISSNYGLYRSSAAAVDIGVSYDDTVRLFQVSLVMKNMGSQLKKYENSRADDLPFDVEIGITKRLANAPVQFSVTAHHLQQFNIRYSDSTFNNDNGLEQNTGGKLFTVDKIFRHLVFAGQVFIGAKIELTVAYNYLLRKELIVANTTNGFTGFSFGAGALFKKLQIRYARSHYQNNTAYNQLGLNIPFNNY